MEKKTAIQFLKDHRFRVEHINVQLAATMMEEYISLQSEQKDKEIERLREALKGVVDCWECEYMLNDAVVSQAKAAISNHPHKCINMCWIPIEDNTKPDYMQSCLIVVKDLGHVIQAQFGGSRTHPVFGVGDEWYTATHWMPLPNTPQALSDQPIESDKDRRIKELEEACIELNRFIPELRYLSESGFQYPDNAIKALTQIEKFLTHN